MLLSGHFFWCFIHFNSWDYDTYGALEKAFASFLKLSHSHSPPSCHHSCFPANGMIIWPKQRRKSTKIESPYPKEQSVSLCQRNSVRILPPIIFPSFIFHLNKDCLFAAGPFVVLWERCCEDRVTGRQRRSSGCYRNTQKPALHKTSHTLRDKDTLSHTSVADVNTCVNLTFQINKQISKQTRK